MSRKIPPKCKLIATTKILFSKVGEKILQKLKIYDQMEGFFSRNL